MLWKAGNLFTFFHRRIAGRAGSGEAGHLARQGSVTRMTQSSVPSWWGVWRSLAQTLGTDRVKRPSVSLQLSTMHTIREWPLTQSNNLRLKRKAAFLRIIPESAVVTTVFRKVYATVQSHIQAPLLKHIPRYIVYKHHNSTILPDSCTITHIHPDMGNITHIHPDMGTMTQTYTQIQAPLIKIHPSNTKWTNHRGWRQQKTWKKEAQIQKHNRYGQMCDTVKSSQLDTMTSSYSKFFSTRHFFGVNKSQKTTDS